MLMRSRATDGRSASNCQQKWPDQPLCRRTGCLGLRQSSVPPAYLARMRKKRKNSRRFGVHPGNPGSIDRGAQNLPGNWESKKFNLPLVVHSQIPRIGDEDTSIVLHNDAVVQGLSEVPYMHDVERWGYLQSAPASATPASPIVGKESLRAQFGDARYAVSGRNSIQPFAKSLWHENEQSIRQGTGRRILRSVA